MKPLKRPEAVLAGAEDLATTLGQPDRGAIDRQSGETVEAPCTAHKILPRCVGYAELMAALGVSRSTIYRAWRGPFRSGEPRLPPPSKIGARSVWLADVAAKWLHAMLTRWRSALKTGEGPEYLNGVNE